MLMIAWNAMSATTPEAEVGAEGLRGVERRAQAAPDHDAVEGDQQADADEAELLADDGEDEVGVRLGEEEELLPPVAQAQAR